MLNTLHMNSLKEMRNSLLSKTDKCLFIDFEINGNPISEEQKNEILLYRKKLKDLPDMVNDFYDVNDVIASEVFPSAPEWFKG